MRILSGCLVIMHNVLIYNVSITLYIHYVWSINKNVQQNYTNVETD